MDQKQLWEKAVAFHGHECGGLTIGYKAALYAIELLDIQFSDDEQIVCVTENDACGVDAIQAILGCSAGKGNRQRAARRGGDGLFRAGNRRRCQYGYSLPAALGAQNRGRRLSACVPEPGRRIAFPRAQHGYPSRQPERKRPAGAAGPGI